MRQLINDELAANDGRMVGPCGELVPAGDVNTMAEKIRAVIGNMELYVDHSDNARIRVAEFFQMHEIMSSYNGIYRAVGNITHVRQLDTAELDFLAPMVS